MQYNGTIYGKVRGKYIPLEETAQDIQILKQKFENAEKALRDITKWDDDLINEWGDPGERAQEALRENDKIDS